MASNYYLKLGFRHALDNVNNLIKPFWLQIGYNNHIDIDRYLFFRWMSQLCHVKVIVGGNKLKKKMQKLVLSCIVFRLSLETTYLYII